MEIKLHSKKEKNNLKNMNINFKPGVITGIYGDFFKTIPDMIIKNNSFSNYKKISYIERLNKDTFLTEKVSDEFYLIKKDINVKEEEYLDKIISSLKMVGLKKSYLKRKINTLSKSEKRLLDFALKLVTSPDIIIIDEPFLYLNNEYIFSLKKILFDLKEKYSKTVIILSNDSNTLYELTDEVIIMKDNIILIRDTTSRTFREFEFLEKNEILLPDMVMFMRRALNHDEKLTETKDRDTLIKEVLKYAKETNCETQSD